MESSSLAFLASVLAVVASMPLLARCCVFCVSYAAKRESEAIERRRAEAERKAHSLLRQVLTEPEYRQLEEERCLTIRSPNVEERVYRIHASRDQPVDVYESDQLIARLCLQPEKRLPVSDVVLLHKLMIEGNERAYLREANVVRDGTCYW